jgi:hypothetical protein
MRRRMALVAALVVAATLSVWGLAFAQGPSSIDIPNTTAEPCQTHDAAKHAIDKALAHKRWRQEHPLRGVEIPCKSEIEVRSYLHKVKKSFFAYADKQFRACSPRDCQKWARRFVAGVQFRCLVSLWNRESGWVRTRSNYGGSGAYGIPQALPGSKMGPGWQSDGKVQIHWGLGYIDDRYGTPCNANAAQASQNWY